MGYYMSMRESKFYIAKADQAKALAAALELCNHPEKMRGGSWDGTGKTKAWFSWVDMDEFKAAKNLAEAIEAWGWKVKTDAEGNITGLDFGENKIGQEELLFEAIAPFVREGSYLEMSGEDDTLWRWVFKGGCCCEVTPTITWND